MNLGKNLRVYPSAEHRSSILKVSLMCSQLYVCFMHKVGIQTPESVCLRRTSALLWNNPPVHREHILLSLVNKELTGLQLGRKRLGERARLGRYWEEGGQSLESQADAERSKMGMPY